MKYHIIHANPYPRNTTTIMNRIDSAKSAIKCLVSKNGKPILITKHINILVILTDLFKNSTEYQKRYAQITYLILTKSASTDETFKN